MSTLRVDAITDAAGTGAPNFPNGFTVTTPAIFSVRKNANQVIVSGAATTITWPVEEFDVGSNFAADTFTVPATDYYEFNVALRFEPSSGAETITSALIQLYKNGSVIHTIERVPRPGAAGTLHTINGSLVLSLAASDAITVSATITTLGAGTVAVEGASATDTSYFQGKRLLGF